MHGRPRIAPKPEDAEASAAKASTLRSLQSQLLQFHHNLNYSIEALDVCEKLLAINPEWYTGWNYRKLAVAHNLKQSESDPDAIKSILDHELRVVEGALRQNYKSYGAWYHRKWVLNKGHSSIDHELRLLEKFQKADSRNFHAWSYRRFVAALKDISDEEELKFTTDMININFSNYSAWHNRSIILSHLLKKGGEGFSRKEEVLKDEYELVHQALFTDPDDQSGWFYHLWLVEQAIKPETPLLMSSWPTHGSDLILSADSGLDDHALSPFANFYSPTGTFPLILYFNHVVEGVNSSTVTVESEINSEKDLLWRPLSTMNSVCARMWVTHLNLACHPSKVYPVEVSIGNAQGIVSSSGFHFSGPSRFAFTIFFQPSNGDQGKSGDDVEVMSWREENFSNYEKKNQEPSLMTSFDQLRINLDPENAATEWCADTVANEIALFRELLSEINCKIGKLTLARLLMAHDEILSFNKTPFSYKMGHFEEALRLYDDLVLLDASHSQYYKDERSLVLLRQLTSSREFLLRRCGYYRDSTSSCHFSLRLNNLSLSRFGSFERLFWVQMLDLSYNDLQSIEGLEAMQLLTCLNLSDNKISSFTALDPLKLLKSLKVLNVSHNEIGVHSIDATRYMCSSPMSHSLESDWNFGDTVMNGVEVTKYWDANLIFKCLNLTQLDIVGNAVADENFESFLLKLLPTLKWLDGKKLY